MNYTIFITSKHQKLAGGSSFRMNALDFTGTAKQAEAAATDLAQRSHVPRDTVKVLARPFNPFRRSR